MIVEMEDGASTRGVGARARTHETRGTASRRAILRAAIRVVGRDGLPAASLGAIAREAGTSKPAVLYHFGSRENLLREMARSGLERFYRGSHKTAQALEAGDQARVILGELFAKENRLFFAAVRELMTLGIRDDVIGEEVQRVSQAMARGVALLLPHPPAEALRVAEQVCWCVQGFIDAWLCSGRDDPTRFRDGAVEAVIRLAQIDS